MEIKQLLKLLKLVGGLYTHNWDTVCKIVRLIDKGTITVVSSEWKDRFKKDNQKRYPLDLTKISTWASYQDCAELEFSIDKNQKVICKAKVWESDLDPEGYRTEQRFVATLEIPISFLKHIESNILYQFDLYLNRKHTEYLEKQKTLWINNLKSKILNNKAK